MKISCRALHETEADWSCRGCGKPITADQKVVIAYRVANMGAAVVHVPLRFHPECQRFGVKYGVGAAA